MSKARKLQSEVDSTLKKAHEGVDIWEQELETHLSGANSKENARQFDNLKRDLKKLQKLRELIKGWQTAGELKGQDDKLQEARRRIESCMERFKYTEKEHKVTPFSHAGLKRDDTDPAVVEKIKCADWLNTVVTELETQIEQQEADLEALGPAATGKGKGKSSCGAVSDKAKALSFQITRHQEYVSKIERVLRLLENDEVTPEEVELALKDSLDYFVEAAYEEGAAFIEDEEIWSSLPLNAIEENVGKITIHKTASESNINGGGGGGGGDLLEEEEELVQGEIPPPVLTGENEVPKEVTNEGLVEEMPVTSVAEVIAGLATRGASADATPLKPEVLVLGDFIMENLTPSPPLTAIKNSSTAATLGSPLISPTGTVLSGFGGGIRGGGGGAVSTVTTFSGDTTPTPTMTTTPSSITSGPVPTPISHLTPPPGFAHPLVTPQQQQIQQQQQIYTYGDVGGGDGGGGGPAPGSPFAAAAAAASQENILPFIQTCMQQQQQPQQQQFQSSEEGGSVYSSDVSAGTAAATAAGGFKSPFAAKAATAFTPQPSLDDTSSGSFSYFSSATAAAATAAPPATMIGQQPPPSPLPPGNYQQDSVLPQHAPTPAPSTAHSTPISQSPLGADWFSFSASWIGEADAQSSGASHLPWRPTANDVSLIDSGAVLHRPITGDADWMRSDSVFSTPAEDFYISNAPAAAAADGGNGGGSFSHPVSSSGSRPEWRSRYPTCTPLSYPTDIHPSLKHETTFSKVQLETLFFAFFFHQGSRQQLFAANRLKLQGWRYHMKLSTWFARTQIPEVVNESFEEGVMAYWDPILRTVQVSSSGSTLGGQGPPQMAANGWSQGTTATNFRFEYNLLENENTACPSS
jgi:CCR4-NOT transcription complex subunit 3